MIDFKELGRGMVDGCFVDNDIIKSDDWTSTGPDAVLYPSHIITRESKAEYDGKLIARLKKAALDNNEFGDLYVGSVISRMMREYFKEGDE